MKNRFLFLSLITVLVLTSCQNFLDGKILKDEIESTIEYNNAEEKEVYIMADNSAFGTTTPATVTKYKVSSRDKNKIIFSPADGYFFKYWEVVDKNTKASLSDVIKFEDAFSTETTFTFLKNTSSEILIRPVVVARPSLITNSPAEGTNNPKDSSIAVTFSPKLSEENDFSRISIICENIDIKENFQAPICFGNTVFFSADSKNMIEIPEGRTKTITVTIPADFFYMDGDMKIPVGKEITWSFKINNSITEDKGAPVINEIVLSKYKNNDGVFSNNNYQSWSEDEYYQNHTKEVWVSCKVNDSGMGIKGLKIQETFIKKNDGTGESFIVANNNPYYGIFTKTDDDSFTSNNFTYNFIAPNDGIVKLDIWAEDYAGNISNTPKTYYFAKDTWLEGNPNSCNIIMAPENDESAYLIRTAQNNKDSVSFNKIELRKIKFFGDRQNKIDVKIVYWNDGENEKELISFNNYTGNLETQADGKYFKKLNEYIIDRPADAYTFVKLTVKDDANNVFESTGYIPPIAKFNSYTFNESGHSISFIKKLAGDFICYYRKNNGELNNLDDAINDEEDKDFAKDSWDNQYSHNLTSFYIYPKQGNQYELYILEECPVSGFLNLVGPLGNPINFDYNGFKSENINAPENLVLPDFEISSDEFIPNSKYRTVYVKLKDGYFIPEGFDYSIIYDSDGITYETKDTKWLVNIGNCSVYIIAKTDDGRILKNDDGSIVKTVTKQIDLTQDCAPPVIETVGSNFTITNCFTVKLNKGSYFDLATTYETYRRYDTLDFHNGKLNLYYWFEDGNEVPLSKEVYIEIDSVENLPNGSILLYSIPVNGVDDTVKYMCFKIYDKCGNYYISKKEIKTAVYNNPLKVIKDDTDESYPFRIEFPNKVLFRKTDNIHAQYSTYTYFNESEKKWTQVYDNDYDVENSIYANSWFTNLLAGNECSDKPNHSNECGLYSDLKLNLDFKNQDDVNKSFVRFKFINEDASYKTMYLYPKYYTGNLTVNTKSLTEAVNGAVIFADQPCFIHTVYCQKDLGDDAALWATKGIEVNPLFKDISSNSFFSYEIDTSELPSGNYYCIVAHFADGSCYKTSVKQKSTNK